MSPLSVNITVLTNSWKNPILYMRVSCMCVHECAPIVCVRTILTHLHTCVPGICSCTCFGFWGAASRILRGDRWGGCCLSCFVQLSTESGQMILKGQSFAHTHSQSPYSHTHRQRTDIDIYTNCDENDLFREDHIFSDLYLAPESKPGYIQVFKVYIQIRNTFKVHRWVLFLRHVIFRI